MSLTSIISTSTWPNIKSKDSFEILRTCSFQNWPYFFNFAKFELRNCQKTNFKLFLWTHCSLFLVCFLNDCLENFFSQSSMILNAKKNPNFSSMVKYLDLELPEQEMYCPPLTIRVLDCRSPALMILVYDQSFSW